MLAVTSTFPQLFASGALLALIQVIAALPWLYAIDPAGFRAARRKPAAYAAFAGVVAVGGASLGWFLNYKNDLQLLDYYGKWYGLILQLQLALDVPILLIGLVLSVWPRGGTVALAAFREGYRQPMFWLLVGFTVVALAASMVIPYFTFGDDFKMMKQLSFDMIMLATALFCVLAASMSISEEIEGR